MRPLIVIIFSVKRLSEDPYLKSFISKVRTKQRERFCSSRASVIRLPVATYFLSSLPCDEGTIAVNDHGGIKIHYNDTTTNFILYNISNLIGNHHSMVESINWEGNNYYYVCNRKNGLTSNNKNIRIDSKIGSTMIQSTN